MTEGVSWTGGILLVRIPPARETTSDNVPLGVVTVNATIGEHRIVCPERAL